MLTHLHVYQLFTFYLRDRKSSQLLGCASLESLPLAERLAQLGPGLMWQCLLIKKKNHYNFVVYEQNHLFGAEFQNCLDRGKFPTLQCDVPRGAGFYVYKTQKQPMRP